MCGQQRNIFRPIAQRRNGKRNHVETVEEILAEIAALDFLFEILVGGGDYARIHLNGLRRADRLKTMFIQRPKHFGLRLQTHVPDFVEEKSPAVRLLQFAYFVVGCAIQIASPVAEQLAFDQVFRNRSAVHFDEWSIRACAQLMHRTRDQLLTGAALAINQDAPVRAGHQLQSAGGAPSWPRFRR